MIPSITPSLQLLSADETKASSSDQTSLPIKAPPETASPSSEGSSQLVVINTLIQETPVSTKTTDPSIVSVEHLDLSAHSFSSGPRIVLRCNVINFSNELLKLEQHAAVQSLRSYLERINDYHLIGPESEVEKYSASKTTIQLALLSNGFYSITNLYRKSHDSNEWELNERCANNLEGWIWNADGTKNTEKWGAWSFDGLKNGAYAGRYKLDWRVSYDHIQQLLEAGLNIEIVKHAIKGRIQAIVAQRRPPPVLEEGNSSHVGE